MQTSPARLHDTDEESFRAGIRARLDAAHIMRPNYYDRLEKRYGTKIRTPRPCKPTLQSAYEDFVREIGRDVEIAVTLSFKDSPLRMGGISARLNVERTLDHYLRRLNRAAFGHGARRRGQTLTAIVVIEGERSNKRLHAHLGLSRPQHIDLQAWIQVAVIQAKRCKQVGREIQIEAVTDQGWLGYLVKEGPEALAPSSMRKGRP